MQIGVGGPITGDEPEEVIRYYELWRKIANFAGNGPYDEADWKVATSTFVPT